MRKRLIFPLFLGIAGCAILLGLGKWQIDRLAWKEEILAGINARLSAAPVPLELDVTEEAHEYSAVTLRGTSTGDEIHVLDSGTAAGTGYRVIAPIAREDGTTVLVDLGLLPLDQKDAPPAIRDMQITGNLLWPDDKTKSTPEPDLGKNIWFARDLPNMARALQTEPILVVASQTEPADPRLTPLPVNTANIKNDHLEYAITWFLLAAVWAIMSLYLIYRTTRAKDDD